MNHDHLSSPVTALRAAHGPDMRDIAHQPIGVFDSGIGGLSVWHHLKLTLPHEDFIYVADTAHVPYGDKTQEWIQQRMLQVVHWFIAQGCKAVVIACNTATAMAATFVRQQFPELFIVGLEPAIKPAVGLTQNKQIAMLATARTVGSQKYADLLERTLSQAPDVQVTSIACVGLAEKIDAGQMNTAETLSLIQRYLEPVQAKQADVVVLGCTHYPFVSKHIQAHLAEGVKVIDSGAPVARYTKDILTARHGLNSKTELGNFKWYASQIDENTDAKWRLFTHEQSVSVQLLDLDTP